MAAGHLVSDLKLTLDGDVDLDHLYDARRQIVATLQLLDLVLKNVVNQVYLAVKGFKYLMHFVISFTVVTYRNCTPN